MRTDTLSHAPASTRPLWRWWPLGILAFVAACAAPTPKVTHIPYEKGMESVMGKPATAAFTLLGAPALDRQEGEARQLQFRGSCTLDIYYYRTGTAEPVANYAAARLPNGQQLTPATCLQRLAAQKSAGSR